MRAQLLPLVLGFVVGCGGSSDPGTNNANDSQDEGGGGGGDEPGDGNTCEYVDILFVIDNSPSMGPYQEALAKQFPAFVDAIYDSLPTDVDLHVGITTTSFFSGSCSESTNNCASAQTPMEINAHYVKPTEGTTGVNGEQGRLYEYDGKSYFATNTSDPDRAPLKQWFSAAAVEAGESGCSYEMASAAAGYAVHPSNAATNAGFIRDINGVLVVIFLSDEPDKSPEGVSAYHDMLVAAKQQCGGDACILAAGIINPCTMDNNDTIWQTLNAFGEAPIWGDIDDTTSYDTVVGDALAQVVNQTCESIVIL
ncbi:MAG: hypothetical protein AB7O24_13405 [Kofleriaceae bacterium]